MKVYAEISHTYLENDYGREIEGTCPTCSHCGHITESFGNSDRSVKRCLVLLREECPLGNTNFYTDEERPDIDIFENALDDLLDATPGKKEASPRTETSLERIRRRLKEAQGI